MEIIFAKYPHIPCSNEPTYMCIYVACPFFTSLNYFRLYILYIPEHNSRKITFNSTKFLQGILEIPCKSHMNNNPGCASYSKATAIQSDLHQTPMIPNFY